MKNKNKLLAIIIPIIIAIAVLIAFAVSGNITKNNDKETPTATTTAVPVNEDTTVKHQDSKVTILCAGDNLIHNTLIYAGEQEDGTLDYTCLYENIKPEIERFDIAVLDLETILGGSSFEYSGYPVFNTPWEVGEAAINAGFDIFTCATNHTMDMGYAGIEKEAEFFSNHKDVVSIGIATSEEDYNKVTYYEKNGIIFAMLNYTFGTNGIPLPADKPWCVNLLENKDKIVKDLKEARANADVVMVFPHWGTEYSTGISSYQKEYAKLFYENGVDIVVGCHPHVIEPVEWYSQEGSDRRMLVYYSTGNFISHQIDLENLVGGLAEITIEKKDESVSITTAKFVPVVTHYNRDENGKFRFNVYKLADYNNDLASTHSQKGGTVEYYTKFVSDIVSDEFLAIE